jgi:hypothetical protein
MRTDGIMTTTLPRYEALVVPVAADLLAAWGRNVAATTFDLFSLDVAVGLWPLLREGLHPSRLRPGALTRPCAS